MQWSTEITFNREFGRFIKNKKWYWGVLMECDFIGAAQ